MNAPAGSNQRKMSLPAALALLALVLLVAYLAKQFPTPENGGEVAKVETAKPPQPEAAKPEFPKCEVALEDSSVKSAEPPAKPADKKPSGQGTTVSRPSTEVPGGGLEAHERAGGHTLERHVGKTEDDLFARLESQPDISAASSFPDRDTAEAAIASLLKAHAREVQDWLNDGDGRLTLRHRWTKTTGLSVRRNSNRAQQVNSLRAVLEKSRRTGVGYFILTAYPES